MNTIFQNIPSISYQFFLYYKFITMTQTSAGINSVFVSFCNNNNYYITGEKVQQKYRKTLTIANVSTVPLHSHFSVDCKKVVSTFAADMQLHFSAFNQQMR